MQWIEYIVWTDGGCRPNPGRGGWGAIVIKQRGGFREEAFGGEDNTTNNRMEMQAAIEGLKRTPERSRVLVCTDSEILARGGNGDGKTRANLDLWEVIREMMGVRRVEFKWVKGHAGEPLNERAHHLAVLGRTHSVEITDEMRKGYEDADLS